MNQETITQEARLNDIDVPALLETIEAIRKDPAKGKVKFHINSDWKNQTHIESNVDSYFLGGEEIKRNHTIVSDEPFELNGQDTAANPQELLFAALNSCMMVGYVVGAAVQGITLEKLEIKTEGELDLRGFLGIDETVIPGYDSLQFTVHIKGNGTPEQFRKIHETVTKTSPNHFNVAHPIQLNGQLVVE